MTATLDVIREAEARGVQLFVEARPSNGARKARSLVSC
jgi:hypothetical protein